MSMSAHLPDEPAVPSPAVVSADPQAIRASLPYALVGEFDQEWDIVMEKARAEKSLAPVHVLLGKWRHVAQAEARSPGSTKRLLEKAAVIERAGHNASGASIEKMRAMIERRLA